VNVSKKHSIMHVRGIKNESIRDNKGNISGERRAVYVF